MDRIAEPWGERTPYGPEAADGDSTWPVRVDTYLEPGTGVDDVERWVQSASVLHSNGDAFDSPCAMVASWESAVAPSIG